MINSKTCVKQGYYHEDSRWVDTSYDIFTTLFEGQSEYELLVGALRSEISNLRTRAKNSIVSAYERYLHEHREKSEKEAVSLASHNARILRNRKSFWSFLLDTKMWAPCEISEISALEFEKYYLDDRFGLSKVQSLLSEVLSKKPEVYRTEFQEYYIEDRLGLRKMQSLLDEIESFKPELFRMEFHRQRRIHWVVGVVDSFRKLSSAQDLAEIEFTDSTY